MADVLETILAGATKTLAVRLAGQTDLHRYALDRAQRLIRVVGALAERIPEALRPRRVDLVKIAAIYTCVPLAGPAGAGAARAEDDGSELAADQLKDLLPAGDVELVLKMLLEYRRRNAALGESRLLSDAVALEDIGMVGLWNQTRNFHAAGKTLEQLLRLWKTQQDYGYWETRLREGLHFEVTRVTAQRRLDALHAILERMNRENAGTDVG
jgi:hypothetical protein